MWLQLNARAILKSVNTLRLKTELPTPWECARDRGRGVRRHQGLAGLAARPTRQ